MSILAAIIQHNFGSPSHGNQRRKRIQIEREVKLSLFAHDIILYIMNPKEATRNLLVLINEFDEVVWYKIKTQKSHAFLYTSKKDQGEKIRKQSNLPSKQQQQQQQQNT